MRLRSPTIGVTLALLFVASPSSADSFDSWSRIREIQLSQAMMDEHTSIIAAYQDLIKHLPSSDPVRSQALYELGRIRYQQGDLTAARARLKECVRKGSSRSPCLELLSTLELVDAAITKLPTRWDFNQAHGFVRPWSAPEGGSIRVTEVESNSRLEWSAVVHSQERDRLHLALNLAGAKPEGVAFTANPSVFDGYLQVIASDVNGVNWYSDPLYIPKDSVITVDAKFDSLRSPGARSSSLVPALLNQITIEDVTSSHSLDRGTNLWLLDDFSLY